MGSLTLQKEIYKGSSPTFTFTVLYQGSAFNLTGYTVSFSVKTSTDATSYSIGPDTCTLTSATGGICTVTLTSTETDITAATYLAELKLVNGTTVHIPLQFDLVIKESVSG